MQSACRSVILQPKYEYAMQMFWPVLACNIHSTVHVAEQNTLLRSGRPMVMCAVVVVGRASCCLRAATGMFGPYSPPVMSSRDAESCDQDSWHQTIPVLVLCRSFKARKASAIGLDEAG